MLRVQCISWLEARPPPPSVRCAHQREQLSKGDVRQNLPIARDKSSDRFPLQVTDHDYNGYWLFTQAPLKHSLEINFMPDLVHVCASVHLWIIASISEPLHLSVSLIT